jgi:hypothetical protein
MTQKIFISHTTSDDPFVAQLRNALEKQGLEIWVDSQNLRGGDTLKTEIESAIKDASAFIVVISPNYFRKTPNRTYQYWPCPSLPPRPYANTSGSCALSQNQFFIRNFFHCTRKMGNRDGNIDRFFVQSKI